MVITIKKYFDIDFEKDLYTHTPAHKHTISEKNIRYIITLCYCVIFLIKTKLEQILITILY